jgi:arylsulfatase A-like enzyme
MRASRVDLAVAIVGLGCVGAAFGPQIASQVTRRQPEPPKGVVLVVLDAARASSVGAYGGRKDVTPHLDALAAESQLFEQAFTPAVYTRAAMAALWTSRDPGQPGQRRALRLAEVLKAAGVGTAGFVANPNAGHSSGHERGFEEFRQIEGVPPPPSEELVGDFGDFLERKGKTRFFAYLHLREPHFPYAPPPPFALRFGGPQVLPAEVFSDADWMASLNLRKGGPTSAEALDLVRAYEANLGYADHLVGQIRARLEAAGLAESTALIVTADHGEALGEHGRVGHNDQAYAESAHIPMLLRVPGRSARRSSRLVSLLDVAPTIAQLFGVSPAGFEGVSLMAEEGPPERGLLCVGTDPKAVRAFRDARYSLVTTRGRTELFDRRHDPGETQDLAPTEPVLLSSLVDLRARAEALRTTFTEEAPALEPKSRDALRALGYLQ